MNPPPPLFFLRLTSTRHRPALLKRRTSYAPQNRQPFFGEHGPIFLRPKFPSLQEHPSRHRPLEFPPPPPHPSDALVVRDRACMFAFNQGSFFAPFSHPLSTAFSAPPGFYFPSGTPKYLAEVSRPHPIPSLKLSRIASLSTALVPVVFYPPGPFCAVSSPPLSLTLPRAPKGISN